MKLSLSICAKELPAVGDYYAKATLGDEDIGKTYIITASANPSWKSVLTCEEPAGETLTISVCNVSDDSVVAFMTCPMDQLVEQSTVALDADGSSGSAVLAVHCEEYEFAPGTLQLKLEGHGLKNKERGFGFLRKSDPFYVLSIMDGEVIYQSEVISNDLSPTWKLANIDLAVLYAANLDLTSPLSLVIYDKDKGDKKDFMGTVSTSVQLLLEAHHMRVADEKGAKDGLLRVKRAKLVGHGGGSDVSQAATQALENAANALLASQDIDKAKEVAAKCQERVTELEKESATKQTAATEAAEDTAQAKAVATELEQQAIQAAKASKTKMCSGSLQLSLKGGDLLDTDGLFNKSDPFYQIYGADGGSMYQSEVVQNSLDPTFEMAELDIFDLTNGNLEGPLRITLHEQDKGEDTEYLGQIVTSVKDIMQAKPSDRLDLKKGDAPTQGHMFVAKAELIDYKDLKEEAAKLQTTAQKAKAAIPAQEKVEQLAAEEAKKAQGNAKKAKEAADSAQKQVEQMEVSM